MRPAVAMTGAHEAADVEGGADRTPCPVCGDAKAPGLRFPSRFCTKHNGRCRKKNRRWWDDYQRRFARRHGSRRAPPHLIAAVAAVRLFGRRAPVFSLADFRAAAACWGIRLNATEAHGLAAELLEDGVFLETVTPQGPIAFVLDPKLVEVSRRRGAAVGARRRSVRRGARVAGHDAGGDGFLTSEDIGDRPLATPPPALRAGRRRALAASTATTYMLPPASAASAKPGSDGEGIVNVAPPHVDGGTTLSIKTSPETWAPELRALAAARGRLPATTSLTTSAGNTLTASVKRMENGGVSLIFEGEAQLDLHPRSGHVNLITKADALWTSTIERWLTTWPVRASEWLLATPCESVADAVALGWKVAKLELAADFTGLVFRDGDQALFTGRARKRDVRSEGFKLDSSVETIEIGRRGHGRMSISTHDKTQAVRKKYRCEPGRSFYTPTWTAHGWDGTAPIRRVEVRASAGALLLHSDDGEILDLREPTALLNPTLLNALWRHATTKLRLVQRPSTPTASFRPRRAPVDPRWLAVQNASPDDGVRFFRVGRAPARELAMRELVERTRRKVELAMAGLASRLGLNPATVEHLAREHVRAMFDVRTPGPCPHGAEERSGDVS